VIQGLQETLSRRSRSGYAGWVHIGVTFIPTIALILRRRREAMASKEGSSYRGIPGALLRGR